MRERLQRRKKTPKEQASEPAPPPLQPAYFDAGQAPAAEATSAADDAAQPHESAQESAPAYAIEDQPSDAAMADGAAPAESVRPQGASSQRSGARGRSRRRGGRGRGGARGGTGREKAVAQAFAPAVVKGPGSVEAEGEGPEQSQAAEAANIPTVAVATQRAPKGLVVLAIGLPGSGKSSWFKRNNIVPLSSDMLRSLLFDDVREQRFQDLVFSNMRSMLKARLIARRPTNYVDATNLTPQERAHWIKLAKDYNYEVQAVFFDVPLEVCIERHQRRDRVVPEDIMRRMAGKMKAPSFEEGFTKITVVRVKKKEGEPAAS